MHFQSSLAALALLVSSAWADSSSMSSMSDMYATSMMMSSSMTMMSTATSKSTTMMMSSSSSMSKPTTTMSSSTSKPTTTMTMSSTSHTTSSTTSKSSTTSTTTKPTTTMMSTMTSKPTTTMTSTMTTKPTTLMTSSHTTAMLLVSTMSNHTTAMTTSTPMTTKTTVTLTTKTTIVGAMATTSAVTVHVVKVSDMNNTLVFTPNSLVAAPGSLVQFQFFPMNHSVVQAAFSNPCTPIKNVMPSVQGLFSGFMPTNGILTPIFTILINDTQPIWYYCSQGMHCQLGMVGVINPPANETIAQFAALAKSQTTNITPTIVANTTIHPSVSGMPMPTSNVSMTTPPLALQTKNAAPASFAPGVLTAVAAMGAVVVGWGVGL